MRSICCECNILFDVKEPYEQDDETHGYCDQCFEMVMANYGSNLKRKQMEVKSNE